MDNLTHRRQGSSSQAVEDEDPQYMDEQEQEDLIVTLHEQNRKSNVLYKVSLIVLSVLISILFALLAFDKVKSPSTVYLPLPLPSHKAVIHPLAFICCLFSIAALSHAGFVLWFKSPVDDIEHELHVPHPNPALQVLRIIQQNQFGPSAIAALVPWMSSLYLEIVSDGTRSRPSFIEVMFWGLPLGMVLLQAWAVVEMRKTDIDVRNLHKLKYNYKTA